MRVLMLHSGSRLVSLRMAAERPRRVLPGFVELNLIHEADYRLKKSCILPSRPIPLGQTIHKFTPLFPQQPLVLAFLVSSFQIVSFKQVFILSKIFADLLGNFGRLSVSDMPRHPRSQGSIPSYLAVISDHELLGVWFPAHTDFIGVNHEVIASDRFSIGMREFVRGDFDLMQQPRNVPPSSKTFSQLDARRETRDLVQSWQMKT
mmetsp:Transcript_4971/g.11749  ORF Transcript_4971/g.11749 Transcript_4971/m.11749 type:complete len:205 (-) Transcript_4971:333-947(-)